MSNNYPTIFIHGFMGWGEFDGINNVAPYWGVFNGNLMTQLREKGYEVYAPSLGPTSSAWDRACELYALLFGGTVDYGKVHAEKYHHKRYGRTYKTPLIDGLGEGEKTKFNVIGHSFGGPTVITFVSLMINGCQEEVEGTPEEELSDFFKGGKGNMIHTATTLSGVNNGTALASALKNLGVIIIDDLVLWTMTAFGNTNLMKVIDFHMDQWGVMDDPSTVQNHKIRSPFAKQDKINIYNSNPLLDSIGHEMQIEAMYEINKMTKDSDDIYYFARRANRAHPKPGKKTWKMDDDTTLISKLAGPVCCNWRSNQLQYDPRYNYDKDEWMPNDGLVNVPGLSAPFNKKYVTWEEGMDIVPGTWYNMPIEHKDHMSWMGLGEDKDTFLQYYVDMLDGFKELPDGETVEV